MKLSRSVKTFDATPVRKLFFTLITGFIALISATVGEPTWRRQSPFNFRLICVIEPVSV